MHQLNCLIIAGEKSGEEHALSFLPELKNLVPLAHFFGVGGDSMSSQGVELLYHLKDFSSWGISEVFHRIPFYMKAMQNLLQEVERRNCRVAILIDFQTFNLKIAQRLKKRGVQVLYYVAPQAWAWKAWRAKTLGVTVHTLFTIIPFEKDWFTQRGVPRVKSVIHPVLYHYRKFVEDLQQNRKKSFFEELGKRPIRVLLLPGSRNFEVFHLLPQFLEAIEELKVLFSIETLLVKSTSVSPGIYQYHQKHLDKQLEDKDLVDGLKWADLCLASSGTVTLSTALFQVPTLVCYKASLFTSFIYYNFISYRGPISLANIVHQEMVFPELIQDEVTSFNIKKILKDWLTDRDQYEKIVNILKTTSAKIRGEDFSLPHYLASVINESLTSIS